MTTLGDGPATKGGDNGHVRSHPLPAPVPPVADPRCDGTGTISNTGDTSKYLAYRILGIDRPKHWQPVSDLWVWDLRLRRGPGD